MSNHPNRNWRRRWTVDLEAGTATHNTGLVVRFTPVPGEPGAYDGEVIAGLDAVHGLSPQQAARMMREAGDIYAESTKTAGQN
jgi:hypothetical protein